MDEHSHIRVDRLIAATLVAGLVLLLSLGARSGAFHSWLHGDDVACVLAHGHVSGGETGEDSPEQGGHDGADPLQPFCQLGWLGQVIVDDLRLERPIVVERVGQWYAGRSLRFLATSSPPRAPPRLV